MRLKMKRCVLVLSFLLLNVIYAQNVIYDGRAHDEQTIITSEGSTCFKPVDDASYLALYAIYTAAGGTNWTWLNQTVYNGIKWDFDDVKSVSDGAARPCRDNWQGVYCLDDLESIDLCYISSLDLSAHNLVGFVPDEIGNITLLTDLSFGHNFLQGSLPSTLGQLTHLNSLQLFDNQFTSTIPTEIGLLSLMELLTVKQNELTGELPLELYSLLNLQSLDVGFNRFTGSIANNIGNLTALNTATISQNLFSGQFPTKLQSMRAMVLFYANSNKFTGSIPSQLGDLSLLEIFEWNSNFLSSTIPTELALLDKVIYLGVGINLLTGTLPSQLGRINRTLLSLSFADNSLTGTIPSEYGNLAVLQDFTVVECLLTGTFPSEFRNLKRLRGIFADSNFLTGSFPNIFGGTPHVEGLAIGTNLLTSTFPSSISILSALADLYASTMYLTGTIVDTLSHRINELFLSENYFTGSLGGLFNENAATLFPRLLKLEFTQNGFSGSFPSSIFALPSLLYIYGNMNCFSGRLACQDVHEGANNEPIRQYYNKSLLSIINLNGLSSGMGCRNYILSRSVLPDSGYYPDSYISGSIPSCLWQLPSLVTLYLVGNGFTGSIMPSSAILNITTLRNLSLASNELTGTIPESFLTHNFTQLDLSSNRIVGNVDSASLDVCSTSKVLDLSVNRLSGELQLSGGACSINNLAENVLEGNAFTFNVDAFPIDQQDVAVTFNGSFTLNVAMIAASTVLMVALVICVVGLFCESCKSRNWSLFQLLVSWNDEWQLIVLPASLTSALEKSFGVARIVVSVMCGFVAVLLVLYSLLKPGYGTYQNQNSWVATSAYFHEVVPVVSIAVLLLVALTIICVGSAIAVRPFQSGKNISGALFSTSRSWGWLKMTVVYATNIGVAGLANWGYLFAILNNTPHIQLIQITLSVFKLSWNAFFISSALRWAEGKRDTESSSMLPRYMLKLTNFVLIPCAATALVSGNCFLKLFQQQAAPLLVIHRCNGYGSYYNDSYVCEGNVEYLSTEVFDPPFIYSYQCSSAVIANYVPVLLYSFAISGFIIPATMLLYLGLRTTPAESIQLPPSPSSAFTRMLGFVEKQLPSLWNHSSLEKILASKTIPLDENIIQRRKPLISIDRLISTLLLNMTLFYTFGFAVPYLGAVIICATILEAWVYLLAVGKLHQFERTVRSSPPIHQNANCLSPSNKEVMLVDWMVASSFQSIRFGMGTFVVVVIVICAFWGVMFFDMVADVSGTKAGLTVMTVFMLLGPCVCMGAVAYYQYIRPKDSLALLSTETGALASEPEPLSLKQIRANSTVVDDRYSINSNNPVISELHNSTFSKNDDTNL